MLGLGWVCSAIPVALRADQLGSQLAGSVSVVFLSCFVLCSLRYVCVLSARGEATNYCNLVFFGGPGDYRDGRLLPTQGRS